MRERMERDGAGLLADAGTDARGHQDCPLAHRRKRQLKYIVARQKLDAACRRMLVRKIGKKLPALEALLRPFD